MCSVVNPDTCEVETFGGASTGSKGGSWTYSGWTFDIYNPFGNSIRVENHPNFGTAVRLGCNTTAIDIPSGLSVRYVTFPINGTNPGQGWMDILAVDTSGDIVDQTYRYNEQSHGAEAVYLGPVGPEEPALDKIVIHTVQDPDSMGCGFMCSEFYIGEIRACATPNTN